MSLARFLSTLETDALAGGLVDLSCDLVGANTRRWKAQASTRVDLVSAILLPLLLLDVFFF